MCESQTSNVLRTLFPSTRYKILVTTLNRPEKSWQLSELAQHLNATPSSLQREIALLVNVGILERSKRGARVYLKPRQASPIVPRLRAVFEGDAGSTSASSRRQGSDHDWLDRVRAKTQVSVERATRSAITMTGELVVCPQGHRFACPSNEASRMTVPCPTCGHDARSLDYFVRMGRSGGRVGGYVRAEKLTPEQRRESARKAVLSRWAQQTSERHDGPSPALPINAKADAA